MCVCCAASFSDGEDTASEGVVEVRMTVDESGDVSMLSGEVNKWFRLHAELPVETLMDPALLVANTHILFNPKRGDIKVASVCCCRPPRPLGCVNFPFSFSFAISGQLEPSDLQTAIHSVALKP